MKPIGLISILLGLGITCAFPQDSIVSIPDTAFLYALIEEGVDTNGDSLISYEEAANMTSLDVSGSHEDISKITDLTGIEAFINLVTLKCGRNEFSSLDLSNCTKLEDLDISAYCYHPGLCGDGIISSLDLSKNIKLEKLDCSGNLLNNLDLGVNTLLSELSCVSCGLTSLNVSNNPALTNLVCRDNQLTSLDVSNNTNLQDLDCCWNQITNLDLSKNPSLQLLCCFSNQLSSLDLSKNTALEFLRCLNNQLSSLDLSHNTSLTALLIGEMPTLHEVCVWTIPFPTDGIHIDTTGSPNVYFTTECFYDTIVFIPDTAFLYALIDEGVDTNGDSLISYGEAELIDSLIVAKKQISDITGIDAFINLEYLNCSQNLISSMDVSNNSSLTALECTDNLLTSLNVSINSALSELVCADNEITELDVSKNTALRSLVCENNNLISLSISGCKLLWDLYCTNNQLKDLDVSENDLLFFLYCGNNQLTRLDLSNNLILFQSGLPPHAHVHINDMPSLYQVCYPSDIEVPLHTINTTGSPNVCFQQDCNGECTVARIDDVYGSGISVFPNPTHNILIIESGISDLGNIEITSLNGQLIRNEEMEGASYQLDLSSLGSGVYFITIRSMDFVTTRRILKL